MARTKKFGSRKKNLSGYCMFGQTEYLYSISLQPQQEPHFFNWGRLRSIFSLRSGSLNITLILPDKARRILFGKKKIKRIRSILPEEIASEVATFQFAQTYSKCFVLVCKYILEYIFPVQRIFDTRTGSQRWALDTPFID